MSFVRSVRCPTLPPAIQIVLDHPFLYLIRDIPTGTILFAGKMLDPR